MMISSVLRGRHPEDRGAIIQEPDFPLCDWTLTFIRVTVEAFAGQPSK